ncbi:MAG: hypothetical protein MUE41_09375, partial [Gemmatimonadaceae bacterium]|nr:hypothetical protein [Gemmatimonadaceae bacterium]
MALVVAGAPLHAQLGKLLPGKPAANATASAAPAPDSPQAMVTQFVRDTRARNWAAASRALALVTDSQRARGAELAERLKAVLDQRVALDVESVSPLAEGDTTDGLDRRRERLAEFAGPDGQPARIRLERIRDAGEERWVFSA